MMNIENIWKWINGWDEAKVKKKMMLYSFKILYSVLFNTKSDGLPEEETTDRLQKAVYSFSLWKH